MTILLEFFFKKPFRNEARGGGDGDGFSVGRLRYIKESQNLCQNRELSKWDVKQSHCNKDAFLWGCFFLCSLWCCMAKDDESWAAQQSPTYFVAKLLFIAFYAISHATNNHDFYHIFAYHLFVLNSINSFTFAKTCIFLVNFWFSFNFTLFRSCYFLLHFFFFCCSERRH